MSTFPPAGAAVPVANPRASAVVLDDSTAIYDEEGHALIMLNVSASAVWQRCDGTMTVDQIVNDISHGHRVSEAEIRDDVWLTLGKLASLGLVADAR